MTDLILLTEAEIRELVGLGEEELETVAGVYPLISSGEAVMPPVMRLDVAAHNGEIDIKTAYLPGYRGIAVKVSAGFFNNPSRGLPSLGGLMMVFDSETGLPRAALFDNGYLTDLRTGLAGAVAAGHLAGEDAASVALIGAGVQARYQIRALALVRRVNHVIVWARSSERAAQLADEVSREMGVSAVVASAVGEACDGADIVITATPSVDGLVTREALHQGLHITAVGADAPHKRELGPGVLTAADVVVCDSRAQAARMGEIHHAVQEGFVAEEAAELGEIISGTHRGRTSDRDVTICDLTGTGAQDTAIASLVVSRARAAGLGTVIAA